MPNFAFRAGTSPTLNTSPFLSAYYNLPQGAQGEFSYTNPSLGFEYFLQQMNPSITQDRTLRALYDSLWRRFGIESLAHPGQYEGGNAWAQWLGNQNWNRELAAIDPRMRNESGSQFMRPARWVAFS